MALTLLDATRFQDDTASTSALMAALYPPLVPIVALSPARWRCATGDHRWHTSAARARACAFQALPMVTVGQQP